MTDRTAHAIAIRDHVLALMQTAGEWVEVGEVKFRHWSQGRFRAMLNTPFNPMGHGTPVCRSFEDAVAFERASNPMPYELSVWAGGKVMLIEWEEGGTARVCSFKRGPWQDELLALA